MNVSFESKHFIYGSVSFFSLSDNYIIFTSVLFFILNSIYWLILFWYFMFRVRNFISFMHFHLFLVFQFSLVFLVIVSPWVCLYPSTMASLHCHSRQLFYLDRFYSFPHGPWVWPLVQIAAYVQATLLSNHIVAIYPLVSLLLEFSSAVATTLSMANDLALAPHLYPLFFYWRHHTSIPSSFSWWPTHQKLARIDNTAAPRWYCQKAETPTGSCVP